MMKNSKEVLSSLLKTAQMGQLGIRSVLDVSMKPELHSAITSQLREYDAIEQEAHRIAKKRGWELPELNPSIRLMAEGMSKLRLSFGDPSSKIAAMMIRGNTSGIITGLKNQHRMERRDDEIGSLSQKLLDTESNNVRQMKPFL